MVWRHRRAPNYENVPVPEIMRFARYAAEDDEILELAKWASALKIYSAEYAYLRLMTLSGLKTHIENFISKPARKTVQSQKSTNVGELWDRKQPVVLVTGRASSGKMIYRRKVRIRCV